VHKRHTDLLVGADLQAVGADPQAVEADPQAVEADPQRNRKLW